MIIKIVLGIIVLLLVLPFIVFSDMSLIFWYKITPKKLKYKCVSKFTKEDQEILMLGTIHGLHNVFKYYTFLHIKAAIKNYKPDILLVESRQEEIDRDNIADGPPEMLYSHLIAKSMDIPVRGIDWFTMESSSPGRTSTNRDDIMTGNIIKESNSYKRVLVILGASHQIEDGNRLRKKGYKKSRLNQSYLDKLFYHGDEKFEYPLGTKEYIKKRIDREKSIINDAMEAKWLERSHRVIKELESFLSSL